MELRPVNQFENKIFRKSQSIMSLRFYRSGQKKLEQFVKYEYKQDLMGVVSGIKEGSFDVYKVLDNYTGWLVSQKLRPKTVTDYVVAAKKILRYHDVVILNELFHEKVELPKAEEILDEAPTPDQLRLILARCNLRLKALVLLMATSGARTEEALMLKLEDINGDRIYAKAVDIVKRDFGITKEVEVS